jgi:hypothetical protein
MYAACHGPLSLIQLVLSQSIDLNLCSMVGIDVMYRALLPQGDISTFVVAVLLRAEADANIRMAGEERGYNITREVD